jgi:hypothetical protein
MTRDEQRLYAKGYQAGRKYVQRSYNRELSEARREEFRQRAALVALEILTRPGSNWGTTTGGGHVPYKTMDEYARASFEFADKLAGHTYFSGLASAMSGFAQDRNGLGPEGAGAVPKADAQGDSQ